MGKTAPQIDHSPLDGIQRITDPMSQNGGVFADVNQMPKRTAVSWKTELGRKFEGHLDPCNFVAGGKKWSDVNVGGEGFEETAETISLYPQGIAAPQHPCHGIAVIDHDPRKNFVVGDTRPTRRAAAPSLVPLNSEVTIHPEFDNMPGQKSIPPYPN
jgi:hypothetical protein